MCDTPPTKSERRCVRCGAVLYEGAAWCGMCFEPVAPDRVTEPEPEPEHKPEPATDPDPAPAPRPRAVGAEPATSDEPTIPMWPCPVCDARNPMELDYCAT